MIEIIPAGASAVVSERHHDDHGHGYKDSYKGTERIKDALAAFNTSNAERTANLNQDASVRTAQSAKDIADLSSVGCERTSSVISSVRDSEKSVTGQVQAQSDYLREKFDVGFTAAALAAAKNTTDLVQYIFGVNKDVALLSKDLQITEKNLALGAAQNTAALQMTACNNQNMTMLAFKDAAIQLAQAKCDLAAQAAACCCELKEEIGSVKDALKQQEIDSLRAQVVELKCRKSQVFSPVPNGTLASRDDC